MPGVLFSLAQPAPKWPLDYKCLVYYSLARKVHCWDGLAGRCPNEPYQSGGLSREPRNRHLITNAWCICISFLGEGYNSRFGPERWTANTYGAWFRSSVRTRRQARDQPLDYKCLVYSLLYQGWADCGGWSGWVAGRAGLVRSMV